MTNLSAIRNALKQVATCVNPNAIIPIHQGVKIEKGFLYASTEEIALKVPLELSDLEGVYDFSKLNAAAFALDESELNILKTANGIDLKTKKSKVHVPMLGSVSEWPNIINNKTALNLTLTKEQVYKISGLIAFAGKDDLRPGMKGICFNGEEFAATNGNVIAVYPVDVNAGQIDKLVIPARIFTILSAFDAHIYQFKESTVKILDAENKVLGVMIYRHIDEPYPDYENYVKSYKESDAAEITFEKSEMLNALNVSAIGIDKSLQRIDLDVLPESGIKVSATDFEKINNAESLIHSENNNHSNTLEIGLNLGYLRPALKFIDANNIKMRITLPNKPVIFYADNSPEFVLIMPQLRLL